MAPPVARIVARILTVALLLAAPVAQGESFLVCEAGSHCVSERRTQGTCDEGRAMTFAWLTLGGDYAPWLTILLLGTEGCDGRSVSLSSHGRALSTHAEWRDDPEGRAIVLDLVAKERGASLAWRGDEACVLELHSVASEAPQPCATTPGAPPPPSAPWGRLLP